MKPLSRGGSFLFLSSTRKFKLVYHGCLHIYISQAINLTEQVSSLHKILEKEVLMNDKRKINKSVEFQSNPVFANKTACCECF